MKSVDEDSGSGDSRAGTDKTATRIGEAASSGSSGKEEDEQLHADISGEKALAENGIGPDDDNGNQPTLEQSEMENPDPGPSFFITSPAELNTQALLSRDDTNYEIGDTPEAPPVSDTEKAGDAEAMEQESVLIDEPVESAALSPRQPVPSPDTLGLLADLTLKSQDMPEETNRTLVTQAKDHEVSLASQSANEVSDQNVEVGGKTGQSTAGEEWAREPEQPRERMAGDEADEDNYDMDDDFDALEDPEKSQSSRTDPPPNESAPKVPSSSETDVVSTQDTAVVGRGDDDEESFDAEALEALAILRSGVPPPSLVSQGYTERKTLGEVRENQSPESNQYF